MSPALSTIFLLPAQVVGATFDARDATGVWVLGDGAILQVADAAAAPRAWRPAQDSACLCWAAVPGGILTGDDSGRVVFSQRDGGDHELLCLPKLWISALAAHAPSRTVAVGAGHDAHVLDLDGRVLHRFDGHPSTVAAIAFAPDGRALAAAHYGGVTLHFLDGAPARTFARKGSQIGVTISPDGRFLIAATQDRELSAWPIEGGEPMEMSGYGTKPTSLSWGPGGRHLATSGADGVIVWPFDGARGPFGKRPLELAPERKVLVSAVAFHPREQRIAFGYRDGATFVIGFRGAPEAVAEPDGEPISALAWSPDGAQLIGGGESGRAFLARPQAPSLFGRLFG